MGAKAEDGACSGMLTFWRAIGGRRTTGLPASPPPPGCLGNVAAVGERISFCGVTPARDDLRLIATLGEYVLPP